MYIKAFKDPSPGREGIFLFTTDHKEKQTLFRDEEDNIHGVNTLALATLKHPVRVLCYTFMGNHLHLLLKGRYTACLDYFIWVLHRLTIHLSEKYGIHGLLKVEAADVQVVTDARMLLNEVAYLLRNAYKARIDSPFSYPWAPFEVYFNPYLPLIRGERIPGGRAFRRMFGTQIPFPPDWEHSGGRILNKCFVDYHTVEQMTGSGLELFDRLRIYDLETVVAQSHGVEEQITFTDAEMQEKIRAICQNEYYVNTIHQLDRKGLLKLARTLSRRFSCSKKQLSRLLGIDPAVLDNLL